MFITDANGNPVTQSVVSVTDSSGNPVTGTQRIYKYTSLILIFSVAVSMNAPSLLFPQL